VKVLRGHKVKSQLVLGYDGIPESHGLRAAVQMGLSVVDVIFQCVCGIHSMGVSVAKGYQLSCFSIEPSICRMIRVGNSKLSATCFDVVERLRESPKMIGLKASK